MPCLPCLALPLAAVGGGSALAAHSDKIYIASLVATLVLLVGYIYFRYYRKCTTCLY